MKCRICESFDTKIKFKISRDKVFKCKNCTAYSVKEFIESKSSSSFYNTIDSKIYSEYFEHFRKKQYFEVLSSIDSKSKPKLIDIGASYGWLCQIANSLGFDSYGVEPGNATSNKKFIK